MSDSAWKIGPVAGACVDLSTVARAGAGLVFVLASGLAGATHVSLFIDNLQPVPQVSNGGGGGQFYNLQTSSEVGHLTVTGGLFTNDHIPVGRRAVALLGFRDDLLLLDAQASTLVKTDPNQEAVPIQYFTLDFYGDPRSWGLDPAALVAGFATNYLPKLASNLCAARTDCAGSPDGYFDVTTELGNYPDSLRVAVRTALVPAPEPATVWLAALGMMSVFAASRRRTQLPA